MILFDGMSKTIPFMITQLIDFRLRNIADYQKNVKIFQKGVKEKMTLSLDF